MAKKAKVLLLKPLQGKGNAGDIVDVKIHYANYVLIPQGLAVYYTKQIQNQRVAYDKKVNAFKITMKKSVQEMVEQLQESGFSFIKAANDAGNMYDSISSKTFVKYVADQYGLTINPENFSLEAGRIEQIGDYQVQFTYEDITASLPVHVNKKD